MSEPSPPAEQPSAAPAAPAAAGTGENPPPASTGNSYGFYCFLTVLTTVFLLTQCSDIASSRDVKDLKHEIAMLKLELEAQTREIRTGQDELRRLNRSHEELLQELRRGRGTSGMTPP